MLRLLRARIMALLKSNIINRALLYYPNTLPIHY